MLSYLDFVALIHRACGGDSEAFDELCRHEYPYVRNMLLKNGVRPEDVDDLRQKIFLQLYKKITTLQNPSAFRNYLVRCVLNHAIDWKRQMARRCRREQGEPNKQIIDPAGVVDAWMIETEIDADRRHRLMIAMGSLSEEGRQLVVLRYSRGYELDRIGEILGMTREEVKRRLFRVRKDLRKAVGDCW